jgi:hypothetical protein
MSLILSFSSLLDALNRIRERKLSHSSNGIILLLSPPSPPPLGTHLAARGHAGAGE